jgi:hypothetical protein
MSDPVDLMLSKCTAACLAHLNVSMIIMCVDQCQAKSKAKPSQAAK